jgi:hypothetical protein
MLLSSGWVRFWTGAEAWLHKRGNRPELWGVDAMSIFSAHDFQRPATPAPAVFLSGQRSSRHHIDAHASC